MDKKSGSEVIRVSDNVLINIIELYNRSASSESAFFKVSEVVLKNLGRLPSLTVYDLAELSFTSVQTVSNFARKVGCKSFGGLRENVAQALIRRESHTMSFNANSFSNESWTDQQFNFIIDTLAALYAEMRAEDMALYVDELSRADVVRIYIARAGRETMALQLDLAKNGKSSRCIEDLEAQTRDARTLGENAFVIVAAPSKSGTFALLELMTCLKEAPARVLLIAPKGDILLRDFADHVFFFEYTDTLFEDFFIGQIINNIRINYRMQHILPHLN